MTQDTGVEGIVLLAHGSRDPLWRAPLEALAQRIRLLAPATPVACAYMELCQPDLETAAGALVQAGARQLRVVPLFLGLGKHAREDLPRLLQQLQARFADIPCSLQAAVGEDARLLDTLAQIALHPSC